MTTRAPIPKPSVPLRERELWRSVEARAVLGMKRSKFEQGVASSRIPAPLVIDGVRMWRRRELLDWIAAGAPPATDWKWEPVRVVRIDQYRKMIVEQLAQAQRELATIDQAIAVGEKIIKLRGA